MRKEILRQYNTKFLLWYRLRKHTVIAHWIYGFFCAYVGMLFFPASLALMGMFAGFEKWNDCCDGSNEGASDFWDSLLTYTIGFAIILTLEGVGIVTIRWI